MWQKSAAWIPHGFQWWIHKVGGLWSLQWVLVLYGLLDIPSCFWYWVSFQTFIPSWWSSCCIIFIIFTSAWSWYWVLFEKIHTKLVLIRIFIYFQFCGFKSLANISKILTFVSNLHFLKKSNLFPIFFCLKVCKKFPPAQKKKKKLQPQYCISLEFLYQPGPGTKGGFLAGMRQICSWYWLLKKKSYQASPDIFLLSCICISVWF